MQKNQGYAAFRNEFKTEIVKRAKEIARFCKKRYAKSEGEHKVPVMIATLAESFVAAAKASDCPAPMALEMFFTSFQHAYGDEIAIRAVNREEAEALGMIDSEERAFGFVPSKRTVH